MLALDSRIGWFVFWANQSLRHYVATKEFYPRLDLSERGALLRALLASRPFSRAIEIGSAYGQSLQLFAHYFPDTAFIGIDRDAESVRIAERLGREKGLKNVRFETIDAANLRFVTEQLGAFDLAYSCASFLYVEPERAMSVLSGLRSLGVSKIVFVEQHKQLPDGILAEKIERKNGSHYYLWDFVQLFSHFDRTLQVQVQRVPRSTWKQEQWNTYGSVIQVQNFARSNEQ